MATSEEAAEEDEGATPAPEAEEPSEAAELSGAEEELSGAEEEEEPPRNWAELPEPALRRVLGRLESAGEVLRAGLVCRGWARAVRRNAWPCPRLSVRPDPGVLAGLRRAASFQFPEVREVDASAFLAWKPEAFEALCGLRGPMCALTLRGSLSGLPLGRAGGRLRELGLADSNASVAQVCALLGGDEVPQDAGGGEEDQEHEQGLLEALDLSRVSHPSWFAWRDMVAAELRQGVEQSSDFIRAEQARGAFRPGLGRVDLAGCKWLSCLALKFIVLAAPYLQHVNVSDTKIRDFTPVARIAGGFVQHLNLAGTDVSDVQLRTIARFCITLRHLNLARCVEVGKALGALADGPAVRTGKLTSLDVSECASITMGGLRRLIANWGGPSWRPREAVPGLLAGGVALVLRHCTNICGSFLPERHTTLENGTYKIRFRVLDLHGCTGVTPADLHQLATAGLLGSWTERLDFAHMENALALEVQSPVLRACLQAAPRLRRLALDGCSVPDDVAAAIAASGEELAELSLWNARNLSNRGLERLAAGCPRLAALAVGGNALREWDWAGVGRFSGLTRLSVVRCHRLDAATLTGALAPLARLEALHLAACPSLGDGLAAGLPATLRTLELVCCDALTGEGLGRLGRLRRLRIASCPKVTTAALMKVLMSCPELQRLEVPEAVGKDLRLPVGPQGAGVSRFDGLQVVRGGM